MLSVDSFRFLPRLLKMYYEQLPVEPLGTIPWTPIGEILPKLTIGLVTSAGLYRKGIDPPFDLEREMREPTWGDPSYRAIPLDTARERIQVSHLHYNAEDALNDLNIVLPLDRLQELLDEGRIGGIAPTAYSFMGYQGYPANLEDWSTLYGPQVAGRLKAEGAQCVLLTPV